MFKHERTDNAGTGITGGPVDPDTGQQIDVPEHEHFYICADCGQAVDMRDLGQVFHHEEPGHSPLPLSS